MEAFKWLVLLSTMVSDHLSIFGDHQIKNWKKVRVNSIVETLENKANNLD